MNISSTLQQLLQEYTKQEILAELTTLTKAVRPEATTAVEEEILNFLEAATQRVELIPLDLATLIAVTARTASGLAIDWVTLEIDKFTFLNKHFPDFRSGFTIRDTIYNVTRTKASVADVTEFRERHATGNLVQDTITWNNMHPHTPLTAKSAGSKNLQVPVTPVIPEPLKKGDDGGRKVRIQEDGGSRKIYIQEVDGSKKLHVQETIQDKISPEYKNLGDYQERLKAVVKIKLLMEDRTWQPRNNVEKLLLPALTMKSGKFRVISQDRVEEFCGDEGAYEDFEKMLENFKHLSLGNKMPLKPVAVIEGFEGNVAEFLEEILDEDVQEVWCDFTITQKVAEILKSVKTTQLPPYRRIGFTKYSFVQS